jgi:hypothetical protein
VAEGRGRTGAGDRPALGGAGLDVQRRLEAADEVAGVGQIDIVRAGLEDGAGKGVILALERSRRVDHGPGAQAGEALGIQPVERGDLDLGGGSGLGQLGGQGLQRRQVSGRQHQNDVGPARDHRRQPLAEHPAGPDQDDAFSIVAHAAHLMRGAAQG